MGGNQSNSKSYLVKIYTWKGYLNLYINKELEIYSQHISAQKMSLIITLTQEIEINLYYLKLKVQRKVLNIQVLRYGIKCNFIDLITDKSYNICKKTIKRTHVIIILETKRMYLNTMYLCTMSQ